MKNTDSQNWQEDMHTDPTGDLVVSEPTLSERGIGFWVCPMGVNIFGAPEEVAELMVGQVLRQQRDELMMLKEHLDHGFQILWGAMREDDLTTHMVLLVYLPNHNVSQEPKLLTPPR